MVPLRSFPRAAAVAVAMLACMAQAEASGVQEPLSALPLRREPAEDAAWVPALWMLGAIAAGGAWIVVRRKGLPTWRAVRAGLQPPRATLVRLSSHALGGAASVHAVRWHDEELLIGCSAQHLVVLARRPAASSPGAAEHS
jgi:hypothetical protein